MPSKCLRTSAMDHLSGAGFHVNVSSETPSSSVSSSFGVFSNSEMAACKRPESPGCIWASVQQVDFTRRQAAKRRRAHNSDLPLPEDRKHGKGRRAGGRYDFSDEARGDGASARRGTE